MSDGAGAPSAGKQRYGTSVRLSIVIATKGRPQALARTIASVSHCRPGPAEVIVVDGDERQSARPVVDSAAVASGGEGPPLRYLRSEPGLTRQRNAAIDMASGQAILFLDDDVTLAPAALAALSGAYADPTVVGATGRVIEDQGRSFGNSRSLFRRLVPGGGSEGSMTRFGYPRRIQDATRFRDVEFMHGCFMSARSGLARDVRFDEQLTGYGLAEDEDFSYRLSRLGRIRYMPNAVVEHDGTGAGASATREFNRSVVLNRAYLFRKNFPQTRVARLQFALLVSILLAHRALNGEREGVRGLIEGSIEAWRKRT